MVVFRQKRIITTDSLGEDLQKARKALNLSLWAIEKKLGISQHYLNALENNEWEEIPGEIYRKNFLKKYAEFLGISFVKIKDKYEKELRLNRVSKNVGAEKFGVGRKRFVVLPRIIRNVLIGIVVFLIVGYLGQQIWSLVSPPRFLVVYPEENFVTTLSFIKILGYVGDESLVRLNDDEIALGEDGYFLVDIDLNPGLNVIKLEARKRYGKSKVIYRRIIVE